MSPPESPMARPDAEEGIALPTALLAMMVLLMLGGLFVAYANPQQRATARTQAFETGLHVAESAAEIAVAAMSDPNQTAQPFVAPTGAPADRAAARAWAVDQAVSRVDGTCSRFERTAGGDGVAVVDGTSGTVYGVGFLPDCQIRRTTRVMRVNYDTRPVIPLPATVSILTGGDIHFDHANAKIGAGGIHSNGSIIGTPGSVTGPYSASGTCTSPCTSGSPIKPIPNFIARHFWESRHQPQINPNNDPFYELCPDGTVQQSPPDAEQPCDGSKIIGSPSSSWKWTKTAAGLVTWTWDSGAGPPNGQYYAYRSNIVNRANNGNGNSTRMSLFAEADPAHISSQTGDKSGSITYTSNPKFFPSWPGVGAIADVDLMVERNLQADGQMTMVFAREQFRISFNGKYDRIMFVACDQSLASPNYDEEAASCQSSTGHKSTLLSPIHTTRITQNSEYEAPPSGDALVPNLGISGIGDWEVL
jgi:hypothetical protein